MESQLTCSMSYSAEVQNDVFTVPAVKSGGEATNVTTVITVSPKEGHTWQSYINDIIAKDAIVNGEYVAGSITIMVTNE